MIDAGTLNEAPDFPNGIAHFTEHMLFNAKILKGFREKYSENFLTFSERRHTWYDLTEDEYNFFKGSDWPKSYNGWDSLPFWVQNEIKEFIREDVVRIRNIFSEYNFYGIYAYHFHKQDVVFKPSIVQRGPFSSNEDADVFLNDPSPQNSIEAFEYTYQKYNK
jgi:hypothetical protein